MPDTPLNEEAIFAAALEKDNPQVRAAYLDGACGDNIKLRNRIDLLLCEHDESGGVLDTPPSGLGATVGFSAIAEKPGSTIGRYKLLQQIGEGGMGVVYMAEQSEPVQRKVALKIIKPGMDTQQVIARFEAERQALAMMDHNNIARVLDAGATDSGRPFFIMELVRGVPITKYCDENKLDTRERLDLFKEVCNAVQHAHQKGIIHRDLKPSNVMVTLYDGKPVPKVIDFGVAKATSQKLTDRTMFTQFGQMVGTLEYMSPEQAEISGLDVDTRSDIYSLGVLLYELLTGGTPLDRKRFKEAALDEIQRMIREEEPPKPSTRLSTVNELASISAQRGIEPKKLSMLLRGDLDWIVMKSLEKDRTRRYDSASNFAADVGRYLADEPVEACPPSASYKLRKFTKRNKGPMMVTAALALLLFCGTTISTWQAIRATRAENLARHRLGEVEKERDRVARSESLASERLSETEQQRDRANQAERLASDQLRETEEERNRAVSAEQLAEERLVQVQTEKETAEREKQIALAVKDFLQNKLLGQASVTTQANSLMGAGRLAGDAKPNPTIRELLERAAAELTKGKIETNFPDQPLLQAEILATVGQTYIGVGEYERAIELTRRALELYKAKLGPEHSSTLVCASNLAVAYDTAGKLDLALPLYEETLKLQKAKLGPEHLSTLLTMGYLALAYQAAGKPDLALPLAEETLKLQKAKFGANHPDTLGSMNTLAVTYHAAGKLDLALPLWEETLKRRKTQLGPEHPQTLISMSNLALAYKAAGKLELALPLYEETHKLFKAQLGPDHPHTLTSMNNLATAYESTGKLDLALPLYEETLKLQKAKRGPEHPDTLITMGNLALAYKTAGKLDLALPLAEETLKLQKAKFGANHPATLVSMNRLAVTYRAAGKLDLALPLYEETLKLRKAKLGAKHPRTLISMHNLVTAYREAGQTGKAFALSKDRLLVARKTLPPDSPQLASSLAQCGLGFLEAKAYKEAEPIIRECLAIRERIMPDHWLLFNMKAMLGRVLLGQKKYAEAEPLLLAGYQGMKEREAEIPAQGRIRLTETLERLVDLHKATGKKEEEAKWKAELDKRQVDEKFTTVKPEMAASKSTDQEPPLPKTDQPPETAPQP